MNEKKKVLAMKE